MSSNIKNSLLLIFERVILLGLSFANSILLARLAGPKLFGEFSYIVSLAGIFAPLAVMGLNNIITKYVVKYPKNSHYYIASALKIRFVGAAIAIICAAVLSSLTESNNALVVLLVTMQGFTVFYVLEFFYLAKKKVTLLLKIRLTALTITNFLKLLAILNSLSLECLIFLQGLEYVVIGTSYYILYVRQNHHINFKRQANFSTHLSLTHKGKWLLFSGLAATVYLKIDQIMLAKFVGSNEVAFYAAASKISEFWYVFPVLICNVFTAQLTQYRFKNYAKYKSLLKQLICVLTLAAVVLSFTTYAIAEPLIRFVYGSEYVKSAAILSVHIFASLFIFQRAVLSKWLVIEKLYKYSLVSNTLGAIFNIALNLILIPKYQGLGAAWATLISYFIASYGFLFINAKTRHYVSILHLAMLESVPILKSFFKQLLAYKP